MACSPQLIRDARQNLDGTWQFAVVKAGEQPPVARDLGERILVPYPVESQLPGIEREGPARPWSPDDPSCTASGPAPATTGSAATSVCMTATLDQGFRPDGLYTAPSDTAPAYDLRMHRKMGFDAVRKHIRVEPDRWFHRAGRPGLLVWQDIRR